jgi:hypothetical protein
VRAHLPKKLILTEITRTYAICPGQNLNSLQISDGRHRDLHQPVQFPRHGQTTTARARIPTRMWDAFRVRLHLPSALGRALRFAKGSAPFRRSHLAEAIHTPTSEKEMGPNRINIYPGAFATGRLTCLVLEGESFRDRPVFRIMTTRRAE